MKIGFTGTQQGMTSDQELMLRNIVGELVGEDVDEGAPFEFHHGDCIGADAEAHDSMVMEYGVYCAVVIHPPTDEKKRAHRVGAAERAPKPYLRRNEDIVSECSVLIATPAQDMEITRSGTWSTVRKARKLRKTVYVILPDGVVED